MERQNLLEAKQAFLIYQLLEEFNQLLWDHYEKEFLQFLMEEEPPSNESL
jgi:hypothetical protein